FLSDSRSARLSFVGAGVGERGRDPRAGAHRASPRLWLRSLRTTPRSRRSCRPRGSSDWHRLPPLSLLRPPPLLGGACINLTHVILVRNEEAQKVRERVAVWRSRMNPRR